MENTPKWIEYHKGFMNFIDWNKFNEFDMLKLFIETTFLNNDNLTDFINSLPHEVREKITAFFHEADKAAYDSERSLAAIRASELKIKKSDKKKTVEQRAKDAGLTVVRSNVPEGSSGLILVVD